MIVKKPKEGVIGGWFSEKQDHSSAKKRLNEVAQQILKECRS